MEPLSWTAAVALIGSVATVCATIFGLLRRGKSNGNSETKNLLEKTRTELWENVNDIRAEMTQLREKLAVVETVAKDNKEELERLRDSFEKLNDLLIRLLSEK